MNTPTDDHELFGELRSLLHRSHKDEQWTQDLLNLLQHAREELGEQVYEQSWVPHLRRAPRASWPTPLWTFPSLEKLEGNAPLLPVPCFALRMDYGTLGTQEAQTLAASPLLTQLTSLNLSYNDIGDEGAKAIAASPHLASLSELDLYGNDIADEGARALADSPYLTQLTHLGLNNNCIADEGARALAASPHLAQLAELHLFHNHIAEEGTKALAGSPHLAESIRNQWRHRF